MDEPRTRLVHEGGSAAPGDDAIVVLVSLLARLQLLRRLMLLRQRPRDVRYSHPGEALVGAEEGLRRHRDLVAVALRLM